MYQLRYFTILPKNQVQVLFTWRRPIFQSKENQVLSSDHKGITLQDGCLRWLSKSSLTFIKDDVLIFLIGINEWDSSYFVTCNAHIPYHPAEVQTPKILPRYSQF